MVHIARKQSVRSVVMSSLTCLLLALSAQGASAPSQPPEKPDTAVASQAPGNGETKPAPESKATQFDTPQSGVITVHSPAGEFAPVSKATWEEFLDWLNDRHAVKPKSVPDFNVISATFAGQADDTRALLTATIKIKVNLAETWVSVPLRLNEAILQDGPTYRGQGEHSPGRNDRVEPEAGYVWWFKGEGVHELTLPIVVPVRKTMPSRRLQLAIPPAASSSLKLEVALPSDQLKVVPPKNSTTSTRSIEKRRTEIELNWRGESLDLQWQQLPKLKPAGTALEASTRIEVDLSSEPVVVVAEQTIRALQGQGSFDSVTVRVPAGFGPPSIEGEQYSSHQSDPQNQQRVTVQLTEQTTGPIQLRWTLEAAEAQSGGIPPLEGFEVERARWQQGDIEILTAEGYRVSTREDKNVYRRSVNPAAKESHVANAFRFRRQPFRLVLDVHEIEPYFTVEPHLLLQMSAAKADLDAAFWFEVYRDRGAVREVELDWPKWKSEGWNIDRSHTPGLVEDVRIDPASGSICVRLVQRMTGRFKLPFRASREIKPGDERFDLSLPSAVAPYRSPSAVVLLKADNVEADLAPAGETSMRPLSGELRNRVEIPDEWRDLRRSEWRVDSQMRAFSAGVTIHEQEVATAAAAKVELKQDHLRVSQRITYDVRFERLSQIRLLVPEELKDRVKFFSEDGSSLSPDLTGTTVGALEQARFRLTEDRIGRFHVEALFDIDLGKELSPGTVIPTRIPFIQSADAKYSSLRLELQRAGQVQMAVTDEDWKQQPSMDGSVAWTTTEMKPDVPLELRYSTTGQPQEYVVRKALIRTRFDADGHAQSHAQYRIAGNVATIVVDFPAEIEPTEFFSGPRKLVQTPFAGVSGETRRYRLEFPGEPDGAERLLTIEFHSKVATRFVWSESHRLSGPRFPSNVWVGETRWEVRLPFNQNLFTNPIGYSPLFRWHRDGVFWHRHVLPQYEGLTTWIADGNDSPAEGDGFDDGNVYQFSRFGPTDSLSFYSMSRSLVLLFGAGLALLMGFLLLKIPATRNVLTILIIVFVLAVVGLWHSHSVQLLLQPAIFGLLLAIAAAAIDGYVKRKRSSSILTLSSPSDFVAPVSTESGFDHAALVGVGSEETTAVRPVQTSPSGSASSSSVTGTNG